MKPKHDTKLSVKDMQAEDITLVQAQSDVEYYNKMFEEDFSYFFLKPISDFTSAVFGADSIFLHNNVYYLGEV
jgi:hypothetical protein